MLAGDGRIASMTAALSLSGPRARWRRAADRPAPMVTGSCRPRRRASLEDQLGILQGLRNMRLRREIPRQHFLSLGVHDPGIGRRLARRWPGTACPSSPRLSANTMPSASAARLFCRIRLIASLVRLASPIAPTRMRLRPEDIQQRRRRRRWRRGSPASSAMAVPSRTSVLVPEIGRFHQWKAGGDRALRRSPMISSGRAGRGADHDRPCGVFAFVEFAEQRFDLFAAIDGDDDRAATCGEFARRKPPPRRRWL